MLYRHQNKAIKLFQLTAARRRLANGNSIWEGYTVRFNSQPPEGGWSST